MVADSYDYHHHYYDTTDFGRDEQQHAKRGTSGQQHNTTGTGPVRTWYYE